MTDPALREEILLLLDRNRQGLRPEDVAWCIPSGQSLTQMYLEIVQLLGERLIVLRPSQEVSADVYAITDMGRRAIIEVRRYNAHKIFGPEFGPPPNPQRPSS